MYCLNLNIPTSGSHMKSWNLLVLVVIELHQVKQIVCTVQSVPYFFHERYNPLNSTKEVKYYPAFYGPPLVSILTNQFGSKSQSQMNQAYLDADNKICLLLETPGSISSPKSKSNATDKIFMMWRKQLIADCCIHLNKLDNRSFQEDELNMKQVHMSVHRALLEDEIKYKTVLFRKCYVKNSQMIPTIKNGTTSGIVLKALDLPQLNKLHPTNSSDKPVKPEKANIKTNLMGTNVFSNFSGHKMNPTRIGSGNPHTFGDPVAENKVKGDVGDFNESMNQLEQLRPKRETHVLMTKYRKAKTNSPCRKRRRKPTCRPNGEKTKTTPFLNVNFSGYWERTDPRPTVAARVKNPLKTSDDDFDFVYGKQEKGTRVEAVLSDRSSRVKVTTTRVER